MLKNARSSTTGDQDRIEYRRIDATDELALLAFGERQFDAAVCTMAMMDRASLDPMLSALSRLLDVDFRFVFSVMHPCFNSSRVKLVAEEATTVAGHLVTRYSVAVSEYAHPTATKGVAMKG